MLKEDKKNFEDSLLLCDNCADLIGRFDDLYDNFGRPIWHYELALCEEQSNLVFCKIECMLFHLIKAEYIDIQELRELVNDEEVIKCMT